MQVVVFTASSQGYADQDGSEFIVQLSIFLKIEVQLKELWKRQMLLGIIYITYIYIYIILYYIIIISDFHTFLNSAKLWVKSAFLEQKVSGTPGSRPTGSRTALHFHQALSQEPYPITPRPSYSTFECHYIYIYINICIYICIHIYIYCWGYYPMIYPTFIYNYYNYNYDIYISYITPTIYHISSRLDDEVSIVWNAVALSSRLEKPQAFDTSNARPSFSSSNIWVCLKMLG